MRETYNLYSTKFYYCNQFKDEARQIWRDEKCAKHLFVNCEG